MNGKAVVSEGHSLETSNGPDAHRCGETPGQHHNAQPCPHLTAYDRRIVYFPYASQQRRHVFSRPGLLIPQFQYEAVGEGEMSKAVWYLCMQPIADCILDFLPLGLSWRSASSRVWRWESRCLLLCALDGDCIWAKGQVLVINTIDAISKTGFQCPTMTVR